MVMFLFSGMLTVPLAGLILIIFSCGMSGRLSCPLVNVYGVSLNPSPSLSILL